jgi:hypothetical protein
VSVNVALAVFLTEAVAFGVAFAVATVTILLFGELIPQLFVSRHALAVAANTVWLVKLVIVLTGLVSYPIAYVIDYVVGAEVMETMTRDELKELMALNKHKGIDINAAKIMAGALELSGKEVSMDRLLSRTRSVFNYFFLSGERIHDAHRRPLPRRSEPKTGLCRADADFQFWLQPHPLLRRQEKVRSHYWTSIRQGKTRWFGVDCWAVFTCSV